MDRDGLVVLCSACGAPCRADDGAYVRCAHCGAAVAVPEDVRSFVRAFTLFASFGGQEPPPLEACCPRCGRPLDATFATRRRCAACGADAVGDLRDTARLFLATVRGIGSRRAALRDEMLRAFPVATRTASGFSCGACDAPLGRSPSPASFERCDGCGKQNEVTETMSMVAMFRAADRDVADRERLADIERSIARIEQLEAAIVARRPPLAPALVRLALVLLGIAVFCWVGYRIELAMDDDASTTAEP